MIISETLAARAFPGQDPIGKRIGCCEQTADQQTVWKVVVGVAGDVRSHGPGDGAAARVLPAAGAGAGRGVELDAADDVHRRAHATAIRRRSRRRFAPSSAASIRSCRCTTCGRWTQRLAGTLATARFNTLLLSLLGGIGLLLAASGIYGVIAYFVSQRTQEIGVRIALGASTGSVVRLILGQALRPVAIGAAIGVVAALAASRVIASQLFGVSRTDPLTIAAVVATLIGVALVASAVPARRAAAVDPDARAAGRVTRCTRRGRSESDPDCRPRLLL